MNFGADEALAPHHRLQSFSCGEPSLDDWLRRRALANQTSGASRTFVSCKGDEAVGYYAIVASGLSAQEAIGKFRRNMPEPIPVILLARLAVATSHQHFGLGRSLLHDALARVVTAADTIGIRGVIVHSLSERARGFYLGHGFEPSPADSMLLMVTIADLRAAL